MKRAAIALVGLIILGVVALQLSKLRTAGLRDFERTELQLAAQTGRIGVYLLHGSDEALVSIVRKNSTAHALGLFPGDKITWVNGRQVQGPAQAGEALALAPDGEELTVQVKRMNQPLKLAAPLRALAGAVGTAAPAWKAKWAPVPSGIEPSPAAAGGDVVVMLLFDSSSPGNDYAFTRHVDLQRRFEGQDVQFVYIQMVASDPLMSTYNAGIETMDLYGATGQYGHDAPPEPGKGPYFMTVAYRAYATPWTIVIGRDAKVQFSMTTPHYVPLHEVVHNALAASP